MATQVKTQLIDDIDGETTEGVRTVHIGLFGREYEIDLSPENVADLQVKLEPYTTAARKANGAKRPASKRTIRRHQAAAKKTTTAGEPSNDEYRLFAATHGLDCAPRGRVPQAVKTAYHAERN